MIIQNLLCSFLETCKWVLTSGEESQEEPKWMKTPLTPSWVVHSFPRPPIWSRWSLTVIHSALNPLSTVPGPSSMITQGTNLPLRISNTELEEIKKKAGQRKLLQRMVGRQHLNIILYTAQCISLVQVWQWLCLTYANVNHTAVTYLGVLVD